MLPADCRGPPLPGRLATRAPPHPLPGLSTTLPCASRAYCGGSRAFAHAFVSSALAVTAPGVHAPQETGHMLMISGPCRRCVHARIEARSGHVHVVWPVRQPHWLEPLLHPQFAGLLADVGSVQLPW